MSVWMRATCSGSLVAIVTGLAAIPAHVQERSKEVGAYEILLREERRLAEALTRRDTRGVIQVLGNVYISTFAGPMVNQDGNSVFFSFRR